MIRHILIPSLFGLTLLLWSKPAYSADPLPADQAVMGQQAQGNGLASEKPYRTFIAVQRYNMENNGEPDNPISNVGLKLTFPNGMKMELPGGGQLWPIGNQQVQEINRTFELPYAYVKDHRFNFVIEMVRKGSPMQPCNFEVVELNQFNRAYVCRTVHPLDKESIQVRIFTDLFSAPTEIPSDAIALR